MKKYTADEIETFLKTIDSFLTKRVEVVIIGGTAAALAYKVSLATQDIDTWNSVQELLAAYEKAKQATQLEIPLGRVSVGDAPYHFEDRLKVYKPEAFKKLVVKIPEVIDLILMKTIRGNAHDLDAIEEMVKNERVKSEDLIDRYVTDMDAAIGDPKKLGLNFLAMIERCFGEEAAKESQKKIGFN